MIKKDLVVTVIITFCLTATLFMIVPIRSAQYDPWADMNDDGFIDMKDIRPVASQFGMSGDPTKNVTIAGHATYEYAETVNLQGYNDYSLWNSTAGYESVSILITVFADLWTKLYVQVIFRINDRFFLVEEFNMNVTSAYVVKEYPVSGSTIELDIHNDVAQTAMVNIGIYMRA